jgi:hypothetical protein
MSGWVSALTTCTIGNVVYTCPALRLTPREFRAETGATVRTPDPISPPAAAALATLEREPGVVVVRTTAAIVVVVPLRGDEVSPDDLLPLAKAAEIACTSLRVLRDAIRGGELTAFGRQRQRAIRRGDLAGWIESRRVRPTMGVIDADIERRIARLTREARKGKRR